MSSQNYKEVFSQLYLTFASMLTLDLYIILKHFDSIKMHLFKLMFKAIYLEPSIKLQKLFSLFCLQQNYN